LCFFWCFGVCLCMCVRVCVYVCAGMRLSVLQLDDGYTKHWGDWRDEQTCPIKFPSGLKVMNACV